GGGLQAGRGRARRGGPGAAEASMTSPFSSLRTKLIAAFVAVIGVSLLLASATFAYLLRDYQIRTEEDRLENIAAYNANQVVRWARAGQALPAISTQLDSV